MRSTYPQVSVYAEPEELLSAALDAVVIASPADSHARLALAALESGKDVFVEKPLALTYADALEVASAARSLGRMVLVGHVLLYHPAIRMMLRALREGRIGRLTHVRSRRLSLGRVRTRENVWWSFAPHDVALMLEIFEEFPLSARALHLGGTVPGISDWAYADYCFKDGRSAHIEVGWLDAHKSSRIDLFGTDGILSFADSREGGELTLTRCGADYADGLTQTWNDGSEQILFEKAQPLKVEVQAFIDSVQTRRPALTDVREGVAVVRALAMADESAEYVLQRRPPAQARMPAGT